MVVANVRAGKAPFLGLLLAWLSVSSTSAQPRRKPEALFTIDASVPAGAPQTGYLRMGSAAAGRSPQGHVFSVNDRYLTLDGKPWLPVMGEFHFSRYPEPYWEEEILKMRAGGVRIVATYVFWIHHEEVEGQFEWSGQRNLRTFAELCAKHGMYLYVRVGPWAHGEARNGGLPDWLLKKGPTRVSDPAYLSSVRKYYVEVGRQLKGLLWKDGGPVIGIQLENEYTNRRPNGGAAHISTLKSMAIEAGFDVPLYTVTGWDNAVYPPRDVIPVFGGYADEPWSGSVRELPPDTQGVYRFRSEASGGVTGILQGASTPSQEVELRHYPRFTAELGAGIQITYHRRVVLEAGDVAPIALTALGAGTNLLGYYMYQGGANPQGKLTTLQESQETGYPNDLPVRSYDFQAPLGEFGQMSPSFRPLKVVHQFLLDFGADLAPTTAILPDRLPSGPADATTLRLAARTQGDRGFLFFNNYLRHYPLPEQKGVQVVLRLPSETITVPREPVDLPSQSSFFWPVNLDLGGALLKYATAQPFAALDDGGTRYFFFATCPGVTPEFVFAAATISSLHSKATAREGDRIYVRGLPPSTDVAVDLRTSAGKAVRIVLLSRQQAEDSWKVPIDDQERLLITQADVFSDGDSVHLRSRDAGALSFSIFPDAAGRLLSGAPLRRTGKDGAFARYAASVAARRIAVRVEKIRDALPSVPVKLGRLFDWRENGVAVAPDDRDFERAGLWRVSLPKDVVEGISDAFLDIRYTGDVARLYSGPLLLDDNFFNGQAWEIGLKRFTPETLAKGLDLKILPLRKDAPIYLPASARPDFGGRNEIADVGAVTVTAEYEVVLTGAVTSSSDSTRGARTRRTPNHPLPSAP